jgi:hypothetical protein
MDDGVTSGRLGRAIRAIPAPITVQELARWMGFSGVSGVRLALCANVLILDNALA